MDVGRFVAGPLRRYPSLVDALAPSFLGVLFIVVPLILPTDLQSPQGRSVVDLTLTGPDIALTVISALALVARRSRPLLALSVTGIAAALAIGGDWHVNLGQLAVAVALYNFGLRRPRSHTIGAALISAATLGALSVFMVVSGPAEWGRQDVVLWLCTAAAVAIAVQSRRATILALEDRALRAEESREETARRRVAEDRVRIARELHDVIAHHVAVISVQAGVAEHLIERNPAATRDALNHVRASAKAVLAELQSVLGVLRQDETAQPTAPAPGISRIDDLVMSFRAMGAPIEVFVPEQIPELPPAGDVAAFRLIQEALTNVQKHAKGASTTISVRPHTGFLEVDVTNGAPPLAKQRTSEQTPEILPPTGSGLGLVGMRERVTAAGGTLTTGPTADGGFHVNAHLPLPLEKP